LDAVPAAVQRKAMNWPPRVKLANAVQFRRRFWRRLDATPAAGQRAQGGSEPNDAPKPPNQAFSQWKDHPGGWVIVSVRYRMISECDGRIRISSSVLLAARADEVGR
jgi:hypothetical protein